MECYGNTSFDHLGSIWESGEILIDWKLANVIKIHKKGTREHPIEQRHVSLIAVPGKIMDKFMLSTIQRTVQSPGTVNTAA